MKWRLFTRPLSHFHNGEVKWESGKTQVAFPLMSFHLCHFIMGRGEAAFLKVQMVAGRQRRGELALSMKCSRHLHFKLRCQQLIPQSSAAHCSQVEKQGRSHEQNLFKMPHRFSEIMPRQLSQATFTSELFQLFLFMTQDGWFSWAYLEFQLVMGRRRKALSNYPLRLWTTYIKTIGKNANLGTHPQHTHTGPPPDLNKIYEGNTLRSNVPDTLNKVVTDEPWSTWEHAEILFWHRFCKVLRVNQRFSTFSWHRITWRA